VVSTGRILSVASLISADGKTIYGLGFNPNEDEVEFVIASSIWSVATELESGCGDRL